MHAFFPGGNVNQVLKTVLFHLRFYNLMSIIDMGGKIISRIRVACLEFN